VVLVVYCVGIERMRQQGYEDVDGLDINSSSADVAQGRLAHHPERRRIG